MHAEPTADGNLDEQSSSCGQGARIAETDSKKAAAVGGVFFWRINQAKYDGAGARAEEVLLSVLQRFGFQRVNELANATLLWANCFEYKLWSAAGHCLINHFPRSVELSHKHRLCANLARAGSPHLPPSFVLPQDRVTWRSALSYDAALTSGDTGNRDRHPVAQARIGLSSLGKLVVVVAFQCFIAMGHKEMWTER